jgi:hypothetical protein
MLMAMIGTKFWSLSNSLPIRTVPTWKPPVAYSSMMRLIPAARFFAVQDGECLAVLRLCPLDMLTRSGTPFTNMQSTASVTIQCQSRIILGICTYLIRTGSGGLLTVLPLTPAKLGPKISQAFFTAFLVMLQLDIMFEHIIPRNLQSVGCPNIHCASWAAFASSNSCTVKPSMLF